MRRAWEQRVGSTIHGRYGVCVCVAIVVEVGEVSDCGWF